MTIAKRPPLFIHGLLLAGVISLAACGGGGGGKKVIDTTPDAIAFSAASNAQPNTSITSSPVTITGINSATPISIVGGEYSINGRAFTAAPGTINNGQTLAVRITASDKTNTPKEAVVNVGGVTATFAVTTSADVTPDSFTFAPVEEAEINTEYTSASVNIQGIDVDVPVAIEGGTYSIDGGQFTAAAGTISNGQTLTLRVTSAEKTYTPKEAVVKVGEVTAKFTVTTFVDVTPEAFTFTPVTEAALDKEYASSVVTVKGIDVAVPVSINGGVYSINGGAFTSSAGTVSADQTITVKVTSAPKTDTTKTAVLTIGGITGSFAVSTFADKTPPVAEFKFPTPYTMSEANEVKVRGIATDDNAITEVKLLVRSYNLNAQDTTLDETEVVAVPASETDGVKDFSSWTATIPLTADAENEIKVVATDEKNNVIALEDANKVVIRQADVSSAFPDEENQFYYAVSIVLDKFDGRDRALVASSYGGDENVIAVDLTTGTRSIAFKAPACSLFGLTIDPLTKHIFGACEGNLYEFNLSDGELINSYKIQGSGVTIPDMVLDRNNGRNRLVLLERRESESSGRLFSFELDTETFSIISDADQLPVFQVGESIILDGDNYLVPGADLNSAFGSHIISVSASDGTRKTFSDNSQGSGDGYGGEGYFDVPFLSAGVKDEKLNRLFLFEYWSSRLFTLDLETKNRRLFRDVSYVQENISKRNVGSINMEINDEHIYIADERRQSIIVVDVKTGEKIILSKSKNNF